LNNTPYTSALPLFLHCAASCFDLVSTMALAPLVSYPPAHLRTQLPPELWASCIESWIFLANDRLERDRNEFLSASTADESLNDYLLSYVREHLRTDGVWGRVDEEKSLRKATYLLAHRLFLESPKPGPPLLNWAFLGDFCNVFAKTSNIKDLMQQTWELQALDLNHQMLEGKRILQKLIDSHRLADPALDTCLDRTVALLRACHEFGHFLMVGSDILDSITNAWARAGQQLREELVIITSLGLSSLLEGKKPNVSLLLDHLYYLKSSAERQSTSPSTTLLARIVSTTPLLRKLRKSIAGSNGARAKPLISFLENLATRPKIRLTFKKGKGKDKDEYGHHAFGEMHVHRMSLITQIQDLFPDLGTGFIAKLLTEYHDDPEQVTAHLLDGSLPLLLQTADQKETL
jgi:activating signal cointegrator complex subunit 2